MCSRVPANLKELFLSGLAKSVILAAYVRNNPRLGRRPDPIRHRHQGHHLQARRNDEVVLASHLFW